MSSNSGDRIRTFPPNPIYIAYDEQYGPIEILCASIWKAHVRAVLKDILRSSYGEKMSPGSLQIVDIKGIEASCHLLGILYLLPLLYVWLNQ